MKSWICAVAFLSAISFALLLRGADDGEKPGSAYKPADGFVVHEWGVLSVAGSEAAGCQEQIPKFVGWDRADSTKAKKLFFRAFAGFYSAESADFRMGVTLPTPDNGNGCIKRDTPVCAWPLAKMRKNRARKTDGNRKKADENEPEPLVSELAWPAVRAVAGDEGLREKLRSTEDYLWSAVRKFGSNAVVSGAEAEQFIFYGMTDPDVGSNSMRVAKTENRAMMCSGRALHESSRNTPGENAEKIIELDRKMERAWRCAHFFIVQIADGKGRVSYSREALKEGWAVAKADWAKIAAVDLASDAWRKATLDALAKSLEESGLYSQEARGVAEIWDKEFFKTTGTRAVFLWPREEYDRFFPLTLSQKPDALVRVMIEAVEG